MGINLLKKTVFFHICIIIIIFPLRPTMGQNLIQQSIHTTQNDSSISQGLYNWNELMVNAPEANTITNGSHTIIIAILDSGIDLHYPELVNALWNNPKPNQSGYINDLHGWNFLTNNNDIQDTLGHGTFIASLITGLTAMTAGKSAFKGIASNISLMPLVVVNKDTSVDGQGFANAIHYAVDHGANIISLSLSWNNPPTDVQDALNWAYNKGVLLVSVTGNNAGTEIGINPLAQLPEVMAVGSVNSSGERSSFSQYGNQTEIMAPGENLIGAALFNSGVNSSLSINNTFYSSFPLQFSANGSVSAPIVYAGYGTAQDYNNTNINVTGKIVLVDRGEIYFRDKVSNATKYGAIGIIIANNASELFYGTLLSQATIPAIAITKETGDFIKQQLNLTKDLEATISVFPSNLTIESGTSFSAPIVAATAGLMLSVNPNLKNTWIRILLDRTATDLYPSGRDIYTGYGLLNASLAVQAAKETNKPSLIVNNITKNGIFTLLTKVSDPIGVYRIDFGYKINNTKLYNQTTIFQGGKTQYNVSYNINSSNINDIAYYIAVENLGGQFSLQTYGNIQYQYPNYYSTNNNSGIFLISFIFSIFLPILVLGIIIQYRKYKKKY